MTTTSTGKAARLTGVPTDLDLRRQLRDAREEVRARTDQEKALRAHLERLGNDLAAADHRYTELLVRYVELLTHARAAVVTHARGELAPIAYLQGYLEEIGLLPDPEATPEAVVAQGLASVVRIEGGS